MKCFVASAFGRNDVDAIYDKVIRPVLRGLKITALRVDRVEHNDDIDDKIFELLDQSDFCIADLTYARPSVYYEAGYAFGSGKPVVYLARRDHFSAQNDDAYGNLRVHFDLQMKNIIPWGAPNKSLEQQLRRRIYKATAHLRKKECQSKRRKDAENEFAAHSQNRKVQIIRSKATNLLKNRGFRTAISIDHEPGIHVYKIVKRTCIDVRVYPVPQFTKSDIRAAMWMPLLKGISREQDKLIDDFNTHIVLVPVKSMRPSTFAQWVPHFARTGEREFQDNDREYSRKPARMTITLMDGVKSLPEFSDRFRNLLDNTILVSQ